MARDSRIEWTDHTFNPWWGCTKVSSACLNCYAEAWAKRAGQRVWGKQAERRFFTDNHWNAPLRWNKEAQAEGVRKRVFCASMADVFEDRRDLDEPRERLWSLVEKTQDLNWLLLTKRPELVDQLVPWTSHWPQNVWLGTTVEEQKFVEPRLKSLSKHKAPVLFLSCEPLLGPVDLSKWLGQIGWVIAGGESGPGARPMNPEWARILRDQCLEENVAFHFKQWGAWYPASAEETADPDHYTTESQRSSHMLKASKKRAGRVLDGRIWDQIPNTSFVPG